MYESPVRKDFEYQLSFVEEFLTGKGLDMGCGSCPLIHPDCLHIDISPQPLCEEQVPEGRFLQWNAVAYRHYEPVDFIFSSHMVEDLGGEQEVIDCLNGWAEMIKDGGHIVLMLPDMQGGRYATVAEGGNPSHRIDVGKEFIWSILDRLPELELVQIDTVPHDKSCSIDVVFKKAKNEKSI